VPVEIIFNAHNPGTLFVIRVAGNIIEGPIVKGSIEFAVRQLKTPYIVLLGHTDCGAVKACIDRDFNGELLAQLLSSIMIESKEINQAVNENLDWQLHNLLEVGCVQEGILRGELEVFAMVYDLPTGKISIRSKTGNYQYSSI
jgi:carbonic anhydrase